MQLDLHTTTDRLLQPSADLLDPVTNQGFKLLKQLEQQI